MIPLILLTVVGQPASWPVLFFLGLEIKDYLCTDVDYMLTKWGV